jgi:PRC-barrel domain
MQHSSRLRYVDADEVGSEVVDFDGLKVRTPGGDKLGEVDGFILDPDAQRAYYIVVDSGGWFSSRKFLLPIGHARIDGDGDALVVDVTRDTISRYPEYDRNSFEKLEGDDLRRYERRFADVCCPSDAADVDTRRGSEKEQWHHYRQPDWWRTEYYQWDVPPPVGAAGTRPASSDTGFDERREPEAVGTSGGDVSPYPGGRAEPGDVIGIETGGERTFLGETSEKENDRRRNAEKAVGKEIEDERKDRKK